MKVLGLVWMGTRTDRFDETAAFFEGVMGLTLGESQDGFREYTLPNADVVELFSVDEPDHRHLDTGPVVGFLVSDIAAATAELHAAGIELLGHTHSSNGYAWQHFRGPDGNVYEVVQDDRRVGAVGF